MENDGKREDLPCVFRKIGEVEMKTLMIW
jgi:hypothetical protein